MREIISELHRINMHDMPMRVKHENASGAVGQFRTLEQTVGKEILPMPPVKKPEWKRSETFLRQWRKFRHMTQVEVSDRLEPTFSK